MQSLTTYAPTESVTKILFQPCSSLRIKLKVILANKNIKGNRKRFVNTYEYETNKYTNVSHLSSLGIETQDFLIIENYMSYEEKQRLNKMDFKPRTIYFSYNNIHTLERSLNQCYAWLINDDIFMYSKSKELMGIQPIYANLITECISKYMSGFSDTLIRFAPTILTDKNMERKKGILIMIGKENTQIGSMNIDEISAFVYFLIHFDLCSASMALTNQALEIMSMMKHQQNKLYNKEN